MKKVKLWYFYKDLIIIIKLNNSKDWYNQYSGIFTKI